MILTQVDGERKSGKELHLAVLSLCFVISAVTRPDVSPSAETTRPPRPLHDNCGVPLELIKEALQQLSNPLLRSANRAGGQDGSARGSGRESEKFHDGGRREGGCHRKCAPLLSLSLSLPLFTRRLRCATYIIRAVLYLRM